MQGTVQESHLDLRAADGAEAGNNPLAREDKILAEGFNSMDIEGLR